MRILVVEDDDITNRMLQKYLGDLGFDTTSAFDGLQGWEILCQEDIHFVITDWMMPHMNGLELIKKIREKKDHVYTYIILLTAKTETKEIIEGISCGADDYMVKPFDKDVLAVRVRAGQRIVELQEKLLKANKEQDILIGELKEALSEIKQLNGLLPICATCKKIRDDKGYWNQIELYIEKRSEAEFSHSICPDCAKKLYPDIDIYPDDE